jgi:DNA-directed RNA polymerase subunit alpha
LPIDILDLTTRTYNALKRADITKIGQILGKDDKALASIRNFGAKSVEEIKDKLRERGYGNVEQTPEPGLELAAG